MNPTESATAREAVLDAIRSLIYVHERQMHAVSADEGIAMSDLTALSHLRAEGELSQTQLADRVGISSSSVTVLVDRLERRGFVERNSDPDDRRKMMVSVTPAGELTVFRVRDHFAFALELIPAREWASIADALTQVTDAAVIAGVRIERPPMAESA